MTLASWFSTWPAYRTGSATTRLANLRQQCDRLHTISSQNLVNEVGQLRQSLAGKSKLDERERSAAVALAAETAYRTLGQRPFDSQLIAAAALTHSAVAEMQTGEGKTLAIALAAAALSFVGRGVHVASSNQYLTERDFKFALPLFEQLGCTVGLLVPGAPLAEKQAAYLADITYGAGYEFGFDFLRDQLALYAGRPTGAGERTLRMLGGQPPVQKMQRDLAFAIIDEIDSVLIDEATVPLILNGNAQSTTDEVTLTVAAAHVIDALQPEVDYGINRANGSVYLTPAGTACIQRPECRPPFDCRLSRPWSSYVTHALRARWLLKRDEHYVVDQQGVSIVDPHTGRIFTDRRWEAGLHQAVEHKEGLPLSPLDAPAARVSRQRFYQRYGQLSGATGTAVEATAEFLAVYNLRVTAIPLRLPSRRVELPTRYFAAAQTQMRAAVDEVKAMARLGRPVLIGCRTIARSWDLSRHLAAAGIAHQVLNGCQDHDEALLIAQAGSHGAVTVATNLAGRGTDIRLDSLALNAGGLHVIGLERHESPRVDRQLLGRAARQGDPGSGRFLVSADDDLLRSAPDLAAQLRATIGPDGQSSQRLDADLVAVQELGAGRQQRQRAQVLEADQWAEQTAARLV